MQTALAYALHGPGLEAPPWYCSSSFEGLENQPVSMYLRFGRQLLIDGLKAEPIAAIKRPSIEMIRTFQDVIRQKHPSLDGEWCCMDGLNVYLQQASDTNTKNIQWLDSRPLCHVGICVLP
jgi:hypothetical protein